MIASNQAKRERRKQPRRMTDRLGEDLLRSFSTPQCRSCLEHLGGAVLLLDNDRKFLHATAAMRVILEKSTALLTVTPCFKIHDTQKNDCISAFFDTMDSKVSPFVMQIDGATEQHKLLLHCYRLPKPTAVHLQMPRFLLKFRDSDRLSSHQWHFFVTQFNLTKAEIKLCGALMDGLALRDCSRDWGVTMHTLRSQLKSIFSKTSTRRQLDLVRLIHLFMQA